MEFTVEAGWFKIGGIEFTVELALALDVRYFGQRKTYLGQNGMLRPHHLATARVLPSVSPSSVLPGIFSRRVNFKG
jgi:hypothetical protein